MLIAKNLTKKYGELKVLNDVSLEVRESEFLAIVGSSGAGKSTLLHILGTLDSADSGEVSILGKSVNKLSASKLSGFRNRNIGFVFQFHNLLPEFSAIENICLPAMIEGAKMKDVRAQGMELMAMLHIEKRAEHKPSELSGGEQQRVAVARALINKPAVIFADEPSGNLDEENAEELHNLFFRLRDEFKQTFVIVTHDMSLAEISDRTIRLKDGKVVL